MWHFGSHSAKELIKLVDIFFDPQHRANVYAKFTLMQGTGSRQMSVSRRNITCTPYFEYETRKNDEFYSKETQYTTLLKLHGSVNQTVKFISRNTSSDLYLIKWQLVAARDFVYNSQNKLHYFVLKLHQCGKLLGNVTGEASRTAYISTLAARGKIQQYTEGHNGVLNLPHVIGSNVQFT